MSAFSRHSTIRQVIDGEGEKGRALLLAHGFDTGQGFTDMLSQHQSLEMAQRSGRLRDLEGLLAKLNFDREPVR